MKGSTRRVILASGSPRRKELMSGLDIDFVIDTQTDFKEEFNDDIPHKDVPALMSVGKSHGFHRPLEDDEILITSDTMVLLGGRIMGKPHSRDEAVEMLRSLSGNTHEVITAVTIRTNAKELTFTDSTLVTFMNISDDEISWYIDRYKPYDKAGAYGVQEWIGYVGIRKLEGSFYNVMGFPVHRVYEELRKFL